MSHNFQRATLTLLLLLIAGNIVAAESEFARILNSHLSNYERIKSWEGKVSIVSEGKETSGLFSWERSFGSENDLGCNFFSRLRVPTYRVLIDDNAEEIKRISHYSEFEYLLNGTALTLVDHTLKTTSVPELNFRLGVDERPVTIGTTKNSDLDWTMPPRIYFCADYMFRGNSPPTNIFVEKLLESEDAFSVKKLSVDRFELSANSKGYVLVFEDKAGVMLLKSTQVSIGDRNVLTEWEWNSVGALFIPEKLRIEDSDNRKAAVSITVSEYMVNEIIDEKRLSINSMNFVRGDLLADMISSEVLRFDGSAFVSLKQFEKPQAQMHLLGRLLIGLSLLTIVFLVSKKCLDAKNRKTNLGAL